MTIPPSVSVQSPTECVRLTRRLHVSIAGTLSNFGSEGALAAKWQPMEARAVRIFGHHTHMDKGDLNASLNSLKNAYILSCRLVEYKSSFPVPVGVMMSCIPNNEMTDSGDRYAFTTLPMSSNTYPHTLFEADASQSEGNEWRKNYPEYTNDNLEKHNIIDVQGMPYVFAHETHPVIDLLRINNDIIGGNLEEYTKFQGDWYRLSKTAMEQCCQTIREKVLNRISFHDLNAFQVQLRRLDAPEWTHHTDAIDEHNRLYPVEHSKDTRDVMDRPCSFQARIELTYEIPR